MYVHVHVARAQALRIIHLNTVITQSLRLQRGRQTCTDVAVACASTLLHSPWVWLDLADSMLRLDWLLVGERLAWWSRLSCLVISDIDAPRPAWACRCVCVCVWHK